MTKIRYVNLSKQQLIDVLTMEPKKYILKYNCSLSTQQRLKIKVLTTPELFKKTKICIDDINCRKDAKKILYAIENLKEDKEIIVINKKENDQELPIKKRGRPKKIEKDFQIQNEQSEKVIIDQPSLEPCVSDEIQKVEEVEVEKELNIYDVIKKSNMSFFAEFLENISSLDDLVNLGTESYFNKTVATNEKIVQIFNDLYHIIELEENVEDFVKIKRYNALRANLIQRRFFKDELKFLKENKALLISFCTVFKRAKTFNEKKENRCYTFRQIGKEIGLTGLSKEKNFEEIKVEERMVSLEKIRIKQDRENSRRDKKTVPIDKIKKNWKDLFYTELDTYTRTELYKEASNLYNLKNYLPNFKLLKEYIIEMEIMPELLYNKGYFLITEK